MDRSLDSLSSDLKPVAIEILARLIESGMPCQIVQTGRTWEEHQTNLSAGTSRVARSKHLPRRLRGIVAGTADDDKADAIDLCPWDVYNLNGPDKLAWSAHATTASEEAFRLIRDLGEGFGLRSGWRWQNPHDPGHLEWLFAQERYLDIPRSSAAWVAHGRHERVS